MDGVGLIVFGGLGMLVVAVVAIAMWSQKKRTEDWQRAASEMGLPFVGDHSDVLGTCGTLKVFDRGHSRRFYNAIQGDAGDTRITIGDYRFTTGHGKHRTTHLLTVCILESAGLRTPHCYLRPQVAFFDKLGSLLGGQDIDFADDPAFSNAYVLQADTEAAAREWFDEPVRAWFANRLRERLYFETRGNLLVLHYGKTRKPAEAGQLMQLALEVMELLSRG